MGHILLVLTNLIFPFAALGVLLGFVFSPRRRVLKHLKQELKERCGLEPAADIPQNAIWLHCASVGEVKSISGFIKELKKIYKKRPILVTTSTAAGQAEAKKNPDITKALLAPLDFYPFSRRFVERANPYRLLVVEREIWPNMLFAAQKAGVPVFLINARISQKSSRAYKLIRPLFSMLLGKVSVAAMQDEQSARRYMSLGVAQEVVAVSGNVKYDTLSDRAPKQAEVQKLIAQLGWQDKFILVCGSTHPKEEELILAAVPAWAEQGIKVIFAPRHLERKEEIKAALKAQPLAYGILSEGNFPANCAIVCADTMGLLSSLYTCAHLTFVGGSIVPRGAHNLLEPAILGKTVLFGKSFFNTPDTAQALMKSGGGVLVDETTLQETVLRLSKDAAVLENMSAKAKQTALSFKGATEKIKQMVMEYERKTT